MDCDIGFSLQNNGVNNNTEINNAPDYSYSNFTKALIITSVALLAIGVTAGVVLFTCLGTISTFGTLPILALAITLAAGLVLGGFSGISAARNHQSEISERELEFSKNAKDGEVKLKYLYYAAEKKNLEAIQLFYEDSKYFVLSTLRATTSEEKIKFALKMFEESADCTVGKGGIVMNFLKGHGELRIELLDKLKKKNLKECDQLLKSYWQQIVNASRENRGIGHMVYWEPLQLA